MTATLFRGGTGERLSTSMGTVSAVDDAPIGTSTRFRRSARGSIGTAIFDTGTSAVSDDGTETLAQRVSRRYPTDALESTRSLTYLEWVHEEQTKRMISRSEWFLGGGSSSAKLQASSQSALSSRWEVTPAKDVSSFSKSANFPVCSYSPMHLTLPKQEEDLLISSGDEEMSSVFLTSCSSSMKCSPRPISSVSSNGGSNTAQFKHDNSAQLLLTSVPSTSRAGTDSKMSVEPTSDDDGVGVADASAATRIADKELASDNELKISTRQPLKLLQSINGMITQVQTEETSSVSDNTTYDHHFFSGASTGENVSSETTPAATTAPKTSTIFQYQQQLEDNNAAIITSSGIVDAPHSPIFASSVSSSLLPLSVSATMTTTAVSPHTPAQPCGSTTSSSSGTSIATAVHVAIAAIALQQQQQLLQRRVSTSGVVRRRSWRTHYTRPNKSLEYESGQTKVELPETSHSSPIAYSARSRQASDEQQQINDVNDENDNRRQYASVVPISGALRATVIRQTSAGSASSSSSGKKKIQSRRSTNI